MQCLKDWNLWWRTLHISYGIRPAGIRHGAEFRHLSECRGTIGEKRMKAFYWQAMVRGVVLAGMLAGGSAAIWAQAPAGPQPTSPAQDKPAISQKPAAPQQQKPQEGGVTISVEVPVVTLEVVAATQNGDIIPGLKKENFRVLEDGQPQTITNFGPTDAPITMVVLMEFSARFYGWFGYQAKYWAGALCW